jgi:hypothetical protein
MTVADTGAMSAVPPLQVGYVPDPTGLVQAGGDN